MNNLERAAKIVMDLIGLQEDDDPEEIEEAVRIIEGELDAAETRGGKEIADKIF